MFSECLSCFEKKSRSYSVDHCKLLKIILRCWRWIICLNNQCEPRNDKSMHGNEHRESLDLVCFYHVLHPCRGIFRTWWWFVWGFTSAPSPPDRGALSPSRCCVSGHHSSARGHLTSPNMAQDESKGLISVRSWPTGQWWPDWPLITQRQSCAFFKHQTKIRTAIFHKEGEESYSNGFHFILDAWFFFFLSYFKLATCEKCHSDDDLQAKLLLIHLADPLHC